MNQDVKTNIGLALSFIQEICDSLSPVITASDDMDSDTRNELIAAVCHD